MSRFKDVAVLGNVGKIRNVYRQMETIRCGAETF